MARKVDPAEYDNSINVNHLFLRNEHGYLTLEGITVRGNSKRDYIVGDNGEDVFFGEGNDDILAGERGDDVLYGGSGNDYLYGGRGNDYLYGGSGNDTLDGGDGHDNFAFRARNFGQDTILDFVGGKDKIDFRGSGLTWSDLKISKVSGGKTIIETDSDNRITVNGLVDRSDLLFGPAPAADAHASPDDRSILMISGNGDKVTEGETAVVMLKLSQPASHDVTVQWWTRLMGSQATDFQHVTQPQTVTIKAGEIRKAIEINTIDDDIDEAIWENFEVVLSAPVGALLSWIDTTQILVYDNDDPPEVSISNVTVAEGDTAKLTLELSEASEREIWVYWTTAEDTADRSDFDGVYDEHAYDRARVVVFSPGETSKIIAINTTQDELVESDEQFTVTLSLGGRYNFFDLTDINDARPWMGEPRVIFGSECSATVTIVDDDTPPSVEPPVSEFPVAESQDGGTQPVDTDGGEGEDAPKPATVRGTMAAETLSGAEGADKIICQNGDDIAHGRDGDDRLWGGGGADVLHGNANNDRLYGGKGNDSLYGGAGRDWLEGGKGNDYLHGGKAADTLYGGPGNDRLEGRKGDDLLYGGAGADRFVYDAGLTGYDRNGDGLIGRDRIGDFEDGKDRLDFTASGLQWSDVSVSSNRDGDAVVRVKGAESRIVLEGVDASLIGQDDFLFS